MPIPNLCIPLAFNHRLSETCWVRKLVLWATDSQCQWRASLILLRLSWSHKFDPLANVDQTSMEHHGTEVMFSNLTAVPAAGKPEVRYKDLQKGSIDWGGDCVSKCCIWSGCLNGTKKSRNNSVERFEHRVLMKTTSSGNTNKSCLKRQTACHTPCIQIFIALPHWCKMSIKSSTSNLSGGLCNQAPLRCWPHKHHLKLNDFERCAPLDEARAPQQATERLWGFHGRSA